MHCFGRAKRDRIKLRGIKMRISFSLLPLLVALALPASLPSHTGVPLIRVVEPDSGKVGDVLVIQGDNLDKDTVAAIYLTDETADTKVAILQQSATSISFRIPATAKPGRFALMVLTTDKPPSLIEEPVKMTVLPETTGSIPDIF
jgi:hypothetical protein